MFSFALEVVLVVLAAGFACGVLFASRRAYRNETIDNRRAYILALVAWIPVWFFCFFIWHLFNSAMGEEHQMGLGLPWYFWVLLVIGIIALVAPFELYRLVMVIGILLVVLTGCSINWFGPVTHKSHHTASVAPSATSSPSASPKTSPSPSSSPSPTGCTTYTVTLDGNAGASLFSQGLSPKSEEAKQQVLHVAQQDPRVLQTYYNASPLGQQAAIQNATDIAPIANGGCYTAAGKTAYDQWSVLWKLTKVTTADLPATGTNTGAEPNGPAFQETGAIPDGHGYLVQYVDANGNVIGEHWVRQECGNVVTSAAIVLPARPDSAPHIVAAIQTQQAPPPAPPVAQPPVVKTCEELGNCYTPPPPPPAKTCYSEYGPGYNGTYPDCYKAAEAPQTTYVPPPPASAPGTNPAPAPVVITPTSGGAPTTQATSSQCYYEADGSPAPGPGTGIRCS